MKRSYCAYCAIGLGLVHGVHPAIAVNTYDIQGIPLPAGATAAGFAVVNQTHEVAFSVVLDVFDPANEQFGEAAYVWSQGQLTALAVPVGTGVAIVNSINSAGTVVGTTYDSSTLAHPVMWSNGAFSYLPQGGYGQGEALSINDNGAISGDLASAAPGAIYSTPVATEWNGSTMTNLGNFGSTYATASFINNQGHIAINTAHGPLLYVNGQTRSLTDTGFRAENLNNLDENATSGPQPELWKNGLSSDLHALDPSHMSITYAINDQGQIVGDTLPAIDSDHTLATFWQNGQGYDLNTLIGPNSGWVLTNATGITQDGTIVGTGTYNGVPEIFLLTPAESAPEPTTAAILVLGMLAFARCRGVS